MNDQIYVPTEILYYTYNPSHVIRIITGGCRETQVGARPTARGSGSTIHPPAPVEGVGERVTFSVRGNQGNPGDARGCLTWEE